MYVSPNFETKKALKEALANGQNVRAYQTGPFGEEDIADGAYSAEGPHYPRPHKWYARVKVEGGEVVKVLG